MNSTDNTNQVAIGSTDVMTYLNYLRTWEDASDKDINNLIKEHTLFLSLSDFESDKAIDSEISEAVSLAKTVRDLTVAADIIKIEMDAAAVASIWTFGMSMAVFVAATAEEMILNAKISSKSKELNEKLSNLDISISKKMTPNASNYIAAFKENNSLIVAKSPKGLDVTHCRANLFQFMAEVCVHQGKLDADLFRQYAASCRKLFDSEEVDDVYEALDEFNLSKKTDVDVKKFLATLNKVYLPAGCEISRKLVQSLSVIALQKFGIPKETLKEAASEAGMTEEIVSEGAFARMNAFGKFTGCLIIITSLVDVYLNIRAIVDVIKQCKEMVDKLNGEVRQGYKDYFNSLKKASKDYADAIKPHLTF